MNHETRSVTPPSFVKNRHLARKLTEPRMTPALDDHAGLLTLPRLRREDFSMAYAFPPERLQELQGVISLLC